LVGWVGRCGCGCTGKSGKKREGKRKCIRNEGKEWKKGSKDNE
jgi:hypothetical protein